MKQFLVENTRKMQTIKVTIHNPPFEDENVLEHTSWKARDCKIKEVHSNWDESLTEPSHMDNEHLGED